MRYEDFRANVKGLPLLSAQYLRMLAGDNQVLRNQLMRWKKSAGIILGIL
ncbi:MAG: hypothetical protein ABH868_06480 [bacterium]